MEPQAGNLIREGRTSARPRMGSGHARNASLKYWRAGRNSPLPKNDPIRPEYAPIWKRVAQHTAVFVRGTQNTRKHLIDSWLKQKSAHKNNIQCPDSLRLGPIDSDPGRLSETGLRVNSGFLAPCWPSRRPWLSWAWMELGSRAILPLRVIVFVGCVGIEVGLMLVSVRLCGRVELLRDL
jgi:hypothetical protein